MNTHRNAERNRDLAVELLVVFAVLIALGFPGNLTMVVGSSVGVLLEYGAFLLEIAAMLLSSADHWIDIQLVNLEARYTPLYLFLGVIFVDSMLATSFPADQVISCVRLMVTCLFAIWIQQQFPFKKVLQLISIAQLLFLLVTLAFMVLFPRYSYESGSTYTHALCGLYPSKNSLSVELMFGIIVTSLYAQMGFQEVENIIIWVFSLILQIGLIFMCKSTGMLITLMVIMFFLYWPIYMELPVGWIFVIGSVSFLFITLITMPSLAWFFIAIGKDPTLTGRIPLWNQMITIMSQHHTFLGYGYGMFWRDPEAVDLFHSGFDANSWFANMATGSHNLVLEFWINNGLIGLGALFLLIIYSTRNIRLLRDYKYKYVTAVMFGIMVNGLTERCLGGTYDYKTLLLFLALAVCLNAPPETKPDAVR